MALHCAHCDHTFEPEGSGRPRCPKCMRVRDLKEVEAAGGSGKPGTPGSSTPAWKYAVPLVALLAAGLGWMALRDGGEPGGDGVSEDSEDLAQTLKTEGIDHDALAWVEPSEAVVAFAEQAVERADGEVDDVEAVVQAIRARAQEAAFVPWSLGEVLARPALRPEAVLEVLEEEGGRAQLYPLEVVALANAAARALDADAQVVELVAWPEQKAPLDPSGVLGYYALAHEGRIFDVFAGRTVPEAAEALPLSPAQVVGAGLGLEAAALAGGQGETQEAARLAEQALKLAPKSPTVRCDRGTVWAADGAIDQALAEFEAAAQLRRDAARRYHLASAALLTGDVSRARTWLNQLLTEYPDYALARVSMAAIDMQQGHAEEAARQLELAEQAAPDLHAVLWARAELLAAKGDTAAARPIAQRAFEGRKTLDAHLRYAQFQRKVGDLSGAAETVVAALEAAPDSRRASLRRALSSLVGPAVMMDVEALERSDSPVADSQGGGSLRLQQPGLLGGGAAEAPGLELGGSGAPGDGPLLMMGDTSKLRLRDERQGKLELDLPE